MSVLSKFFNSWLAYFFDNSWFDIIIPLTAPPKVLVAEDLLPKN